MADTESGRHSVHGICSFVAKVLLLMQQKRGDCDRSLEHRSFTMWAMEWFAIWLPSVDDECVIKVEIALSVLVLASSARVWVVLVNILSAAFLKHKHTTKQFRRTTIQRTSHSASTATSRRWKLFIKQCKNVFCQQRYDSLDVDYTWVCFILKE